MQNIKYLSGPASENDLEPFCQLILLAQTDTDGAVRSAEKIRACLRALLPFDPRYVTAYSEDKMVGFLIGCHYNQLNPTADLPERAYLVSDLATHPDFRRHGIATEMMNILSGNVTGLYGCLFDWVPQHTRSFNLHVKLGWQPVRESRGKTAFMKSL